MDDSLLNPDKSATLKSLLDNHHWDRLPHESNGNNHEHPELVSYGRLIRDFIYAFNLLQGVFEYAVLIFFIQFIGC